MSAENFWQITPHYKCLATLPSEAFGTFQTHDVSPGRFCNTVVDEQFLQRTETLS